MNNRGQITIFVIAGIVIIVGILFLLFFYNKTIVPPDDDRIEDPEDYLENCVNQYVEEAVEKILVYGGYTSTRELSLNFSYPFEYYKQGTFRDVSFLCYSPSDYTPCVMIEPNLIKHIREEIYEYVERDVEKCYRDYERQLRNNGYVTDFSREMEFEIKLVPGRVETKIIADMKFRKAGSSQSFSEMDIYYKSKVYDIFILVQEILRQEAKYYNSDYNELMVLNTWAEIKKYQTGDDFKIYTIKDTKTEKETRFAIRNAVLSTPR
jgi:hypothetical protein